MRRVYLDHAATTPLDPRVLEVMLPYLREHFGNASSMHGPGRRARFAVEESREQVAALLGAEPSEIVFTSGGTEADNLALKGLREVGAGLVTSAAEHEAVLRPAERLREEGFPVQILRPEAEGALRPPQVNEALGARGAIVSVMHANNELGTLSPLREIAEICRQRGALLHTDAVQTAGLFRLDVDELGVDLLTLSAHKFYGPKGAGALYVRGGTDVCPLVEGGAQERRRRGGTENVAAVVGLATALRLAMEEAEDRRVHLAGLQRRLRRLLAEALGERYRCLTPEAPGRAVPHVLHIVFPPSGGRPLDGEMLLLNLDVEGVCVSAGSACTAGTLEPSHVLAAVGVDDETARAAVRFSLGKDTQPGDLDYAVDRLARVVRRMDAG